MAWRFVQQPNGLLARFSDIVDDFTDYDMTHRDAVRLCMTEHGMSTKEAHLKVERGWMAGMTRWPDEIETIRSVHGSPVAKERVEMLSRVPASSTAESQ